MRLDDHCKVLRRHLEPREVEYVSHTLSITYERPGTINYVKYSDAWRLVPRLGQGTDRHDRGPIGMLVFLLALCRLAGLGS